MTKILIPEEINESNALKFLTRMPPMQASCLHRLLNTLPGRLFIYNTQGKLLYCNHYMQQWFDNIAGKPIEIVGKDASTYIPLLNPKDPDANKAHLEKVIKNNQRVAQEKRPHVFEENIIADGELVTFISYKAPLLDQGNQVVGIYCFALDISYYKKTVHDLDELKTSFASLLHFALSGNKQHKHPFGNHGDPLFQRFNVLRAALVEDDAVTALTMMLMFQTLCPGIELLTFEHSKALLNHLKQNPKPIDLFILDIKLPDLSGDQLATKLRAMETLPAATPIIALTGYDLKGVNCHVFDGIYQKPLTTQGLIDLLQTHLSYKQYLSVGIVSEAIPAELDA